MKKEHIIFLSLMAASAVVMGILLGFVSNIKYIAEYIEFAQSQAEQSSYSAETENLPEVNNDLDSIYLADDKINNAQIADQLDYSPVDQAYYPSAASIQGTSTPEIIVLSLAERQQILNMLNSLGIESSNNYSDVIREYQKIHDLPQTGNMDKTTLDTIINESVKNKMEQIAIRTE